MNATLRPKKKEPKIRKDGLCVVCKKERNEGATRNFDPFCSSDCCRAYYADADS